MKSDLLHIKKYLARHTYYANAKDGHDDEYWNNFKKMNFWKFLYEIGMYENIPALYNKIKKRKLARQRYINALQTDIRGSGYVFLKRDPKDVFVNNFSKKFMPLFFIETKFRHQW